MNTDDTSLSFGVTQSIQAGQTYLFRYRAKNVNGWGPYSDLLSLIAARRTDKIAPVVTSNEGTNVRITWSEPVYNGGSPLFGYTVKIKTSTLSFVVEEEHCDASDQTIKANRFCLIPMSTLRSQPYNLQLDQLVVATVEGINIIGNSVPSDENTGNARIRTEPLSPTALIQRVDIGTTDV